MLVRKQVQSNGSDNFFKSSSRSLKISSRWSSATRSILCTRQNIFASGEFWIENWLKHVTSLISQTNLPYGSLPNMTDSNACRCPALDFPHRKHKSALRRSGKCCLFATRNIAPWTIPGHRNPRGSAPGFQGIEHVSAQRRLCIGLRRKINAISW